MNPIRMSSTLVFLLATTACGATDLVSVGTDRSRETADDPPNTPVCTDKTSPSCSPHDPSPTPVNCTLACASGTHLRADKCVCDPDEVTSILPKACPRLDGYTEIDPMNPVLIKTAADLVALKDAKRAYYKLANDIDMSGIDFHPTTLTEAIFDGGGHTISNLSILATADGASEFGLFVTTTCTNIHDLTLASPTITSVPAAVPFVGFVAGVAQDTNFERVTVTGGRITGPDAVAGGIVGNAGGAVGIGKVSVDAALDLPESNDCAGGFIAGMSTTFGTPTTLVVRQSAFKGSISAGCIGGAVGVIGSDSTHTAVAEISDTSVSGALTEGSHGSSSRPQFGGLVGASYATKTTISRSNVTGTIDGPLPAGGIVGLSVQPDPQYALVLVDDTWPPALPAVAVTDTQW
jgi:hypothetical protein